MDYNTANDILKVLSKSKLHGLRGDLIKSAIRYARIRADWQFVDQNERSARSMERTFAHNAFIDSCNILARNMAKEGEDVKWRREIGDDRQTIGDFACYIHAIIGVINR